LSSVLDVDIASPSLYSPHTTPTITMFSTQPSYEASRCHPGCDAFDECEASTSTVTGKTYAGGSALRRMTFFFDCESDEEDVYEEDEVSPSDSSASSSSESSGCISRCRSFSSIEDEFDDVEEEELFLSEADTGSVQSISVKRISSTSAALVQLLNSDEYRSDSWNHSVHVQQIVPHGDEAFVLKKKLLHASTTIHTVRDAFEFVRQALEGLVFFHENFIARVPMSADNIRADVGPYPMSEDEADSEIPVRYYYSELEGAGCFEREGESWKNGLIPSDGDNSEGTEVDPFADDVSRFGSLLTSMFKSMPQLHTLASTMTSSDRAARPTAASALESLEQICFSLDPALLDSPIEVSC